MDVVESNKRPDDVQGGGLCSTKVDLSQLCRVCANSSDCLIPIFEGEGLEHELESKIHKHLPIKVSSSGTLPVHLCYQCASTLVAWNDLVVSCVEADKRLHQLFLEAEKEKTDFPTVDYDESTAVDFGVDDGCDDSYSSNRVEEVPGTSSQVETSNVPVVQPVKKRTIRTRLSDKIYTNNKGEEKTLQEEKQDTTEERLISQYVTSNIEEDHNYSYNKTYLRFLQSRFLEQLGIVSKYPEEPMYNMNEQTESSLPPDDNVNHESSESVSHGDEADADCDISESIKHDVEMDINCENSESITYNNEIDGSKTDASTDGTVTITSVRTFNLKEKKLSGEPFRCNICKVLYANNSSLRRHLRLKHGIILKHGQILESDGKKSAVINYEEKVVIVSSKVYYRCDECGSHLKSRHSYKSHIRIHTGERPYTCHICGKSFKASQNLKRHVNEVHTGLKVHQCEFCGNRFASKATRDDHSRTHTGERPYVCDKCGKRFRTKASLHVHLNLHMDKSLFKHECSVCNKKFYRNSKLQAHMRIHTGEKPAECNICGKCFRVTNELTRHLTTHSDKKPFLCSECGVCFAQKRYLKNHTKAHHKRTLVY